MTEAQGGGNEGNAACSGGWTGGGSRKLEAGATRDRVEQLPAQGLLVLKERQLE